MSEMPRVVILITKADIGGAQVHVLEILKQLGDRFHFLLACGEEDYLTERARELGVEVKILKHLKRPISPLEDWRAFKECLALFRKLRPDFIHAHSSKAGVVARLAAWKANIPALFTAHGWAFTEGAPPLQRLYGLFVESLLSRLTGRVITVSEYDYRLAARYHVGTEQKRYLVRNGIFKPLVASDIKPAVAVSTIQLLTIGRLSPVKNHLLLLRALASLKQPFNLRIIGEGDCRKDIEAEIKRLALNDRVELLGGLSDTGEYLDQADIFVLSSNYEGLPLSILEAMSHGLAVVATDVGGVSEAVVHERTGLLSPRQDIDALTDNIDRLIEHRSLALQYGENGRQRYRKYFTAERMIEETESIYQLM